MAAKCPPIVPKVENDNFVWQPQYCWWWFARWVVNQSLTVVQRCLQSFLFFCFLSYLWSCCCVGIVATYFFCVYSMYFVYTSMRSTGFEETASTFSFALVILSWTSQPGAIEFSPFVNWSARYFYAKAHGPNSRSCWSCVVQLWILTLGKLFKWRNRQLKLFNGDYCGVMVDWD